MNNTSQQTLLKSLLSAYHISGYIIGVSAQAKLRSFDAGEGLITMVQDVHESEAYVMVILTSMDSQKSYTIHIIEETSSEERPADELGCGPNLSMHNVKGRMKFLLNTTTDFTGKLCSNAYSFAYNNSDLYSIGMAVVPWQKMPVQIWDDRSASLRKEFVVVPSGTDHFVSCGSLRLVDTNSEQVRKMLDEARPSQVAPIATFTSLLLILPLFIAILMSYHYD